MLELALSFVVGIALGAAALIGISFWLVKTDKKKVKQVTDAIKNEGKDFEMAKQRLSEAGDIAARQLELMALIQAPSKNALHSKYKNDLVQEVRLLEEEKHAILRSIIKDGYDPIITVPGPGGVDKITCRLSEYMINNGIAVDVPPPAVPPESLPENVLRPTKGGKFFVIDGGKGKGTTH